MDDSIRSLERILSLEDGYTQEANTTRAAKKVQGIRTRLLEHIREVSRSNNLSLIIATERAIIEGDLKHYANSAAMTSSLKVALNEMNTIEKHIDMVGDKDKYEIIDKGYSLPKNRRNNLPFDEARQALVSHYTRLNNLDKARLSDDEKKVIDARKSSIFAAEKFYKNLQANSLGIKLDQSKKQGRRS